MKKFFSVILALAMCLALGVPAFATTSQTGNLSTELSSQLPELKLTLPDSTTIILNPYRNQVADSAAAAVGIDKGDKLQVMNGVFSVVSTTANKVHVKAVVTGKVGGSAEFSSTPVPVGATGHKVNLTLTYSLADGTTATVPVPDKLTNPTNVKTISDSELTIEVDVPAIGTTTATATRRVDMQFGGTCSDSPSEDDGPWKETDTVSASFVFTATAVTDDPMITQMYQATNTTTPIDFVVTTVPPTGFKTVTAPGITKIEYRDATATSWTTLDKGSDNWGGSDWSSNGKTLTLKAANIATVLNALAITAPAVKVVKFTLEYTDNASVTQETTYTVKVTVLVPPTATTS